MTRWICAVGCGLLLLGAVLGCGSSSSGGASLRGQFLSDLSEKVAWPTYRGFAEKSAELTAALATLTDTPNADALTQAQGAWRDARTEWKHQDAFRLGPADVDNVHFKVDQAADTQGMDALLSGALPLDTAAVDAQGSNLKGFLAMEYLLFDSSLGNGAVLAPLDGSAAGLRRRAYLRALGPVMQRSADPLAAAWSPTGGNFTQALAMAGEGSATYGTQKEAIDLVINRAINSVESAGLKLSRLQGRDSGGTVRPELEESRRSDNSIRDLLDVVESLRRIYQGLSETGSDVGLVKLLSPQNAALAQRTQDEIVAAKAALLAIPPPLRTAVTGAPDKVEAARAALDAVHATFATEVASNLGVTLKFNDNDGD